ncbi:hypothetical protein SAY87_008163 [Trapa incisa]|uniref:Enoyl reductase (ER) domain-containing protein n=1 Tax=Trapa incisa TaxID=236973 RepID=A0AAN7KM57_9MYRT|nr:hypothetical protein SAY87_008163 [Trapa incisa]
MASDGNTVGAIVESKECYLSAYAVQGVPTSDHIKFRTVALPISADSIPEGHVAVKVLLISVDPYLRTRMTGLAEGLNFPRFELNEVLKEYGIERVIASRNDKYNEGDIVMNPYLPVAEYCVIPPDLLTTIDPASSSFSLPEYLSCLGVPGFTAWAGIEVLGDLKAGSNVFISAAAGGVGMFAGQLAKLKGCRVIGSTGSDEKVKLIKEELGYDDGFNYHKETDFDVALTKYFPDGIDLYFDNVGGKMLEAVLNHVNHRARILLCGMVSQYNKVWTERDGVRNLLNAVGKEVRLEGFMLYSHLHRLPDFARDMETYKKQGKIKSKHTLRHGIESFVEGFGSLFSSSNMGKVIVQVGS